MPNNGRGRGRGRSFSNRHLLPPRGRGNRFGPKYSQESNSLPSTSVTRSVMSIPAAYKISIDMKFDKNTDMWYQSLRQIWKKSQAVTNELVEYFENAKNPYIATLRVVYNSTEFKDAKPKTFPFVVMEEFQSWLNVTSQSKRNLLSLDVKHSAFNIISLQKNFQFIKLVSKIYEFEKDKHKFIATIKYITYQHKYREACQMAIVLHLYDTFSIEDFLIPLVLQDKLDLAEEFLAGSSTHQVTLTTYLDSLLNKKTSVLNNIEPLIKRLEIPKINYDKLNPKPMGKLITRLIKKFNLPNTIAPNLIFHFADKILLEMLNNGRGRGRGRSFSNRHSLPPRGRGNRFGPKYSQESNSLPSTSVTRSVMSIPAAYKISIDTEFDENTDMWYKSLRQIWNLWKKSQAVTNKLVEYFENVENPYIATLRVVYNSIEFKDAKPKTFPFVVMEEFQSWLNVTSQSKRNLLSLDVKHSAFNIISQQKNVQFIKLVSKIYKFEKDKHKFIATIKYIIYQHKYQEACQMAIVLHLYDTFSIEDFLIPLVLQDKLALAEEFLAGSSTHQVTLTKYLDSLLNKKTSVLNNIDPLITRLEIPEIKYDKLHPKPMGKLITRLIKMFNLPNTIAPNLMQKRNESTLQFLVHKRYVENSLGDESWSEMVRDAVGDNIVLQCELVYVVHFYDVQEALRWALYFNLDRNSWPYEVRILEENSKQMCFKNIAGSSNVVTDFWNKPDTCKQSTVPYLKFSLPNSSIILIDTVDKFVQFLINGLRDISIVGIDTEWKPCFQARQNELSLIQIATPTNVYILDVYQLNSIFVLDLWKSLGVLLFNNSDILKLGFDLMTDMNKIRESLPCLGNIYYNGPGYLDLSLLWNELLKTRSFTFPYKGENAFGTSLSTLVEFCLGAKLDKSEQISNWENRPLRPAQVIYAALDAFCLIQIYNTLSHSAEMQNIPFKDICYEIMLDVKVEEKTNRQIVEESARTAEQPPSVNTSLVRESLKIISWACIVLTVYKIWGTARK